MNCVTLQNCENNNEVLIIPAIYSVYIGTVIKIAGSDVCWSVINNTAPCDEVPDVTITQVCDDCITCLPVIEPEIPKVVPEYFEQFTQTSETQNEIDTNVKFANAYWDVYKGLKHGIESVCTNIDIDRITVKKKACDLANLYDTNACIVPTPAPEPEVCVEPTGVPLPAPVTVTYTYGTYGDHVYNPSVEPSIGCCPGDICCIDFLDDLGSEIFTFNFVVTEEITPADLPVLVNYQGCCMLINNVVSPISPTVIPKIKTIDFTNPAETMIINNGECNSCFS